MDDKRLSEIKVRLAKASPWPWTGDCKDGSVKYEVRDVDGWVVIRTNHKDATYGFVDSDNEANEALVIHAPADIAWAVAEIERLRERLTITDEKVEAAAERLYRRDWEHGERFEGEWRDRYLRNARAALLAAGMVKCHGKTPAL